MKRIQAVGILLLICVVILFVPSCRKTVELQPQANNVVIEINAPKLKIFEFTSVAFVKRGFAIISANETLGLLTTEFKRIDESVQDRLLLSFLGQEKPEVQFITSISGKDDVYNLIILAKGRTYNKKRGYEDIVLSDKFMNIVRIIGEEIKLAAEEK